jgi:hypothetical protein
VPKTEQRQILLSSILGMVICRSTQIKDFNFPVEQQQGAPSVMAVRDHDLSGTGHKYLDFRCLAQIGAVKRGIHQRTVAHGSVELALDKESSRSELDVNHCGGVAIRAMNPP